MQGEHLSKVFLGCCSASERNDCPNFKPGRGQALQHTIFGPPQKNEIICASWAPYHGLT